MYLVSGISGEPLYAVKASSSEEWLGASSKLDASAYNSAEFYTTANESSFIDGASASAIASSYQVVSSTATQLYAGSAYLTSVNDNPLSASRAGNAANASMANSAYYDGTGRLISALPDSATVSAIASSYAESAASSKQDTLTFGYNTADQISSIDGSALGGMDEAAVSGIASAYAESAVSSVSGNYYTTANESGFLTAQVQASWSESASASPSYIQDKPDLVDIVAGPGIVVDNPDGNTLRVSQQYPTDETVLFEKTWNNQKWSETLSEPITNFERIRIEWSRGDSGLVAYTYNVSEHYVDKINNVAMMQCGDIDYPGGVVYRYFTIYKINGSSYVESYASYYQYGGTLTGWQTANVWLHPIKIVGIHRIAGGN